MAEDADRDPHVCQEPELRSRAAPPLLADDVWDLLAPVLAVAGRKRGRPVRTPRRQVEGMLLVAREGLPWRSLPSDFGRWNVVYHHYAAFRRAGKLELAADRLEAADGLERADMRAVIEALRSLAARDFRQPGPRPRAASGGTKIALGPRTESNA